MKIYPHEPDELAFRDNRFAGGKRLLRRSAATPGVLAKRNERFLRLNAETGLECACLAYALEEETSVVMDFLRESSWSFGEAIVRKAPFTLSTVLDQLAVALILGVPEQVEAIVALPRSCFTNPTVTYPESMYAILRAEVALLRNNPQTVCQEAEKARSTLVDQTRVVRDDIDAILQIEESIAKRDEAMLNEALQNRHEAYMRQFQQSDIQNSGMGAMDVCGLGLLRIARTSGMNISFKSVYLPLQLLE